MGVGTGNIARATGLVVMMAMLLLAAFVLPAAAQDPYPPDPPTPPPPAADVECDLESVDRTITCEGEGFEPDSTVTLELRDPDGGVLGSAESQVDADGAFVLSAELPCDYDNDQVVAQLRGTDADGEDVVFTETVDVADAEPCPPGTDDGELPLTGVQILILILLALALIAGGALLVHHRRSQHTTA